MAFTIHAPSRCALLVEFRGVGPAAALRRAAWPGTPQSGSNAAFEPSGITPADRPVVRAMIDLGTWQAFRDQGVGPAETVDAVSQMLAARLANSASRLRQRQRRTPPDSCRARRRSRCSSLEWPQ
jgi:hypothetical protein